MARASAMAGDCAGVRNGRTPVLRRPVPLAVALVAGLCGVACPVASAAAEPVTLWPYTATVTSSSAVGITAGHTYHLLALGNITMEDVSSVVGSAALHVNTASSHYTCLNGKSVGLFRLSGQFYLHNGLEGTQCAYGTWDVAPTSLASPAQAPVITSTSPSPAHAGAAFTISGRGFGYLSSVSSVRLVRNRTTGSGPVSQVFGHWAATSLADVTLPAEVLPGTPVTGTGTSARGTPSSWPAVVDEAMNYLQRRTRVPLEAPRALPGAGPVPSSAQASASRSEYSVALYGCPSALPVNNPGIGTGVCGTMADYYGYFRGNAYADVAGALGALRLPAPTCPDKAAVPLAAGVVATLYSGPSPEGNCEAVWHEGHWSFALTGDLDGGTRGDATVPWHQVANEVISYLRGRSLPGAQGYMESDIAGDGLHTGAYWQLGRDVYVASTYHGALAALALAKAMAPYPAP
ncbi:MAG TPA: hypothetical protein VME20_12040 [Acidimicrobiales bacterium]|nr:hypothetical protein [Acidimicrobiales bacterium]